MTRCHFLEAQVLRLLADGGAGVVDEDVEPAQAADRLISEHPAGCRVGDIGLNRHRSGAMLHELVDRGGVLARAPSRYRDRCAGLRERPRDAEPDAGVASGHHGDPAVKIEQSHHDGIA
jgi:hypothetical protein